MTTKQALNLQTFSPSWQEEFENLKQALDSELHPFALSIQHVGSTSVAGMLAKPILDIDLVLHEKSQLTAVSDRLTILGYISMGEQGIEGRFAFRQSSSSTPKSVTRTNWQQHHLYVCYEDSLALKNHLVLRDALRKSAELVRTYSDLKLNLIQEKNSSRENYTRKKTEFILRVLAENGLTETELQSIRLANL